MVKSDCLHILTFINAMQFPVVTLCWTNYSKEFSMMRQSRNNPISQQAGKDLEVETVATQIHSNKDSRNYFFGME